MLGNNSEEISTVFSQEQSCVEVAIVLIQYGDLTMFKSVRIVFGSMYFIIFLLGMLGNLSLVISIISRRSLHSVANFLVANLAISNILLCLTAVPVAPITLFLKKWFFGSFLCKLIPYSQGISVLISSLGLSAVAADRYRHIVQVKKEPWSSRQAFLIIGIIWGVSGIVNLPLFLSQKVRTLYYDQNQTIRFCGEFCGEYSWDSPLFRRFYGTVMLKIQFLIPVALLSYCYSRILQKVRREMIVAQMCLLTVRQQVLAAKRKRHVMYILILMVVAFVLSWLPLSIVNILRDYGVRMGFVDQQLYFSQLIIHSIAMTSVIWNPILYFWMSKTHRKKIKRDFMAATRARRTSCNPEQYSLLECNATNNSCRTSPGPIRRNTALLNGQTETSFQLRSPKIGSIKNGACLQGRQTRAYSSCQTSLARSQQLPSVYESELEGAELLDADMDMFNNNEDVQL